MCTFITIKSNGTSVPIKDIMRITPDPMGEGLSKVETYNGEVYTRCYPCDELISTINQTHE